MVVTRLWPSGNEVDNNRVDVDSNLNEFKSQEKQLRELRKWKTEEEKIIERLEQEAASLSERYHLMCNRTPAELRVQIESVSQANARLISMLASKPRASDLVKGFLNLLQCLLRV